MRLPWPALGCCDRERERERAKEKVSLFGRFLGTTLAETQTIKTKNFRGFSPFSLNKCRNVASN
jgi:hypothetical protein